MVGPVLEQRFGDRFEIRTAEQSEAVWLQHPAKFLECERHLMGVQMLDIV